MIIAVLVVVGLALGSFVNALVWRLHQQELTRVKGKAHKGKREKSFLPFTFHLSPGQNRYSILTGHSMCPDCHHELSALDLVPVLSWLALRGKCRYCKKPISWQYPLVEIVTAVLFVVSYLYWPTPLSVAGWASLALWLAVLVGLVALVVYDVRWMLLPNRIVFPLIMLAIIRAVLDIATDSRPWYQALLVVWGVLIGGGIFYILFQLSNGRWIGGGDVKLGFLLGLLVEQPSLAFLCLFFASILGTLAILPLWTTKKVTKTTRIPFGPFLIAACFIALLWGASIVDWYQRTVVAMPVR